MIDWLRYSIKWLRYAIGCSLMHFGLWLMPRGRAHDELHWMLSNWGRHVKEIVDRPRSGA